MDFMNSKWRRITASDKEFPPHLLILCRPYCVQEKTASGENLITTRAKSKDQSDTVTQTSFIQNFTHELVMSSGAPRRVCPWQRQMDGGSAETSDGHN